MIVKRMKIFRRRRFTWHGNPPDRQKTEMHTENVVLESWWLLGVIPLYVRESTNTQF